MVNDMTFRKGQIVVLSESGRAGTVIWTSSTIISVMTATGVEYYGPKGLKTMVQFKKEAKAEQNKADTKNKIKKERDFFKRNEK